MRRSVALLACALLLGGCLGCARQRSDSGTATPGSNVETPAASAQAGPVDDPSLPRTDTAGRSPSDAVLGLIEALNRRDWTAAYSQYAQPYIDFAQAKSDWTERNEQYEGFTALETRVERENLAFVRVRYTVHYDASDGYARLLMPNTLGAGGSIVAIAAIIM